MILCLLTCITEIIQVYDTRKLTNPNLDSHQQGSYIRKTAWGWYLLCTCCYSSEYCSDKLLRDDTPMNDSFYSTVTTYTEGFSET
jgi:hypothetical protein